jgi:DNA-binding response OmpR family regulator
MNEAKIVVVEDEPSLVETLAYSLRKQGYTLFTAGDGRRALEVARGAAARSGGAGCHAAGHRRL